MKLKIAIRGALLALLASWTASAEQNLIVNGSFETYRGSSPNVDKGFGLDGWTIGSEGGLDVVFSSGASRQRSPYWQAADGMVSLSLNWTAPGSISQRIATTAGLTYRLTFFMAAEVYGGPASRTMDVRWNGVAVASPSFQYTGQGPNRMGWTQFGCNLVGTGNDVLTFQSTTPGAYGPALDAVSLIAVPKPNPPTPYVLAAASGGSTVSAEAGVTATAPAVVLIAGPYTNGQFTLKFQAVAGHAYTVLMSTNLTDWAPVFTNQPTGALFIFTDTNATDTARFYRVQQ